MARKPQHESKIEQLDPNDFPALPERVSDELTIIFNKNYGGAIAAHEKALIRKRWTELEYPTAESIDFELRQINEQCALRTAHIQGVSAALAKAISESGLNYKVIKMLSQLQRFTELHRDSMKALEKVRDHLEVLIFCNSDFAFKRRGQM